MKNTTTNTSEVNPLICYRTVDSIIGLKSNQIYKTKNYDMFATLVGNRGEKLGFEEKRVLKLVALMTSKEYFEEMSIVMINKNCISLDGNNRIEAARRMNMYILFRVLTANIYNGTGSEILSIVSKYNACNPTWSAIQQFKTAIHDGCKLAILLDKLRSNISSELVNFSEADLSVNQMMTLVERNKAKTHSRKRNFSEYYNEDYLKYAKTESFVEEFYFVCKVIVYFKDGALSSHTNGILKQLLLVMWDDSKFNKDVFLRNLKRKGFTVGNTKSSTFNSKVIELGVVR